MRISLPRALSTAAITLVLIMMLFVAGGMGFFGNMFDGVFGDMFGDMFGSAGQTFQTGTTGTASGTAVRPAPTPTVRR
jgi:hypothetical protein